MKKIIRFYILSTMMLILNQLLLAGETNDKFWLNNLEEAQKLAKEQDKKVLVYFSGSDWCLPCMQLKIEVFGQETFKNLADKSFIPVAFDFPARDKNKLPEDQQKYNDSIAEKYNSEGAFPLILVLDSDGLELGKISGYSREGLEKYISELIVILDKK